MSRVWGTKPSAAGIKASIQQPVCSHSNRFHSSLSLLPVFPGPPNSASPSRFSAQLAILSEPKPGGSAHLIFQRDHVTPTNPGLGPVRNAFGAVSVRKPETQGAIRALV